MQLSAKVGFGVHQLGTWQRATMCSRQQRSRSVLELNNKCHPAVPRGPEELCLTGLSAQADVGFLVRLPVSLLRGGASGLEKRGRS